MRVLAACGALYAAAAVALSAYAAHAAAGAARTSLQTAAVFAFGHGVALAVLARGLPGRTGVLALAMLGFGTLLFSGALVWKYAFGASLGVAPFAGTLPICGWLLYAVAALRR